MAYAEDPPPFTGDPTWAARGLLGYSKTTGNTDTTTGNFLFHAAKLVGSNWKFLFGTEGLYGSTHGETTAQAWDLHLQANYNVTDRMFVYGSGRYDDDRFSGFAYQASLSAGLGYDFIKTDATKLSAQVGVGERSCSRNCWSRTTSAGSSAAPSSIPPPRRCWMRPLTSSTLQRLHQAPGRRDHRSPARTTPSPPAGSRCR